MSDKEKPNKPPVLKARLAEALRLNLQRRKAQARSRGKGEAGKIGGSATQRKDGRENAE